MPMNGQANLSGMYQAEVLDTADFAATGKIKIHIMGSTNQDLYEMVGVMTPYGGLPNMGMQALPPIGAIGLITYIRGMARHPVWVGALMRYWQDEEEKELDNNTAHPVEAADPTDFVVKTQYTTLEDQELSGDNKVENVFKMNEEGIVLSKIQGNDNYAYQSESYDPTEEFSANTITIKDEEIRLKVRTNDGGADREFIVNGDELRLEWGEDQTITVTEDKTVIKNGEADIVVDNSGKVLINAENIELNGSDGTGMFYEGFRDFVNQSYNSHTHGTPSGPSSPPVAPFTNTAASESQNVKLS